jgi:hypothetical protein
MENALFQMLMLLVVSTASPVPNPMTLVVAPISADNRVPLTTALGQLGTRVQGGYVLFGIDLRSNPEPQVELTVSEPTPLGAVLSQIVGQVEGYRFQAISEHVIDVYSIKEWSDPGDILNIRVGEFTVTNVPAMNIFSKPTTYIPQLKEYLLRGKTIQACGSIGPGLSSEGPGISLTLHGATIREILNATAEADASLAAHVQRHNLPTGWIHKIENDTHGQPVNAWSFLSSVPHDWERYAPPTQNP